MVTEFPNRFVKLTADGRPNTDIEKLISDVMGSNEPIELKELKGGITNQLLFAHQGNKKMLVRAFGKGTGNFIDRNREYAVHQRLEKLNLAPKLYCQFGNGLIYEYVEGRPVAHTELSHPSLMKGIADRLAQWHAFLHPEDVEALMPANQVGDLWSLIASWVELCPADVLPLAAADLQAEFAWIKKTLGNRGGLQVMGHCDLLSGNVLVPDDWPDSLSPADKEAEKEAEKIKYNGDYTPSTVATFIDYEYALPCPRAFDIANHFQEWQGYDCEKELVPTPTPTNPVLKEWASFYLQAYEHFSGTSAGSTDELIHELAAWWGVPGFYWGVWAAIQASASEIGFDYKTYAKERFSEYLSWKKDIWPTLNI